MKKVLLLLLLAASLLGCQTPLRHNPDFVKIEDVLECIGSNVIYYGDMCAEETSGYEYGSQNDAHYLGVRCGMVTMMICLELTRRFPEFYNELGAM